MEQTGIIDIENPIHMFALHLVFTGRINNALDEFATMFNNYRLSPEHNWTPNQIWMNGILDENHPCNSNGGCDDSVVDQFYGEDPDGPRPQSDINGGVVVAPVEVPCNKEITDYVLQQVNVDKPSSQAGIDIYSQVLQLIVQKREDYINI